MEINRAGFYKWKQRMANPSGKAKTRASNVRLFMEYHSMYPNHGYRWLNAKIRLDSGACMSDAYAHRCCKYAGIVSVSKHYRYKKSGEEKKYYPNYILSGIAVTGPMQVIVSDMTAFWCNREYYELTFYMDLWNNSIVSWAISNKKGDRNTYMDGLEELKKKKSEMSGMKMILHTDQGSVYSSKSFNETLPALNIIRSMSRAGTPTDNAAMESINGWSKEELFNDFRLKESEDVVSTVEKYVKFFNEERPAYALKYLTPKQFDEKYNPKPGV